MNSLIEVTQTVSFTPALLLGQLEYSYSASSQGQAPGPLFWIFWLAFMILMIAACWKIFTKAGQPGCAAIIPIYNWYILCKNRWPPSLVGYPVVDSVHKLHHRDNSLHRPAKEFWEEWGLGLV